VGGARDPASGRQRPVGDPGARRRGDSRLEPAARPAERRHAAASSEARQAYDLTAEHFGPGANGPLILTGTIVTSTDPLTLMADLKADVEKIPA
jgi:hypothetical protein